MVGYIAAAVTKTEKVGFVGGIHSDPIDQFQYGYEAGVAYANSALGKNVKVVVQYGESFTDAAKGKSIANKMFTTDGCDVVYHAAGALVWVSSSRLRSTANLPSVSTATRLTSRPIMS